MLLKVGRHLRPDPAYKLIIAREDGENRFLEGYRKQFSNVFITSHPGPLTLIDGDCDEAGLQLAARICARYGRGRDAEEVEARITPRGGTPYTVAIRPMPADEIPREWYL